MYNESTMSARVRQLIFVTVLIASIIGLLWILLYSSGYSINWLSFTVEPTSNIRVAVKPNNNSYILLLPVGLSSNSGAASFTHLAPGEYQLRVEAPGYLPINLNLIAKANSTLVLEPLQLWPDTPAVPTTKLVPPVEHLTTADLPIVFQAALAQITSGSEQNQYSVTNDQVVVLDAVTHQVTLLSQASGVMTSRILDDDTVQLISLDQSDQILLRSEFSITLASLSDDQFNTLTRVSKPIVDVISITGTPYIVYADDHTVHILDSRSQSNYLDQLVTVVSGTILDIDYNVDLDSIIITTTNTTLRYPLTVAK